MREGGVDIEHDFVKFGLRDFFTEASDFYPELIREFYANAQRWKNRDTEDILNYKNVGVSSMVNGQEILVDESLLHDF